MVPENKDRLFLASRLALIATAMTFGIRANLIGFLGNKFMISPGDMGVVFGTAFWGFTISMVVGGILCDVIGMKRLLIVAFFGHVLGIALTICAKDFWSLFLSTLLVGIANGMVEAVCNPLVATLYPDQKTKKLNQFHVWFPGGIVIAGVCAFVLDKMHAAWYWQLSLIFIPVLAYGVLFIKQKFPKTERVSAGVSTIDMVKECRKPLFVFMVICMLFTSATELGTNQWITELLGNVGVPSILLLVFINGIMAFGRSFAGTIEHRLSPTGMLLFSAVFSAVGLYLMSISNGYWSFAAAAIFAAGICFFWPTMLGFISEYLPKTGALGLAIMGASGMLSVSLILPFIGDLYQAQTLLHLPSGMHQLQDRPEYLKLVQHAKLMGGAATLKYVSVLPAILTLAFAGLFIFRKKLRTS